MAVLAHAPGPERDLGRLEAVCGDLCQEDRTGQGELFTIVHVDEEHVVGEAVDIRDKAQVPGTMSSSQFVGLLDCRMCSTGT
jgi:hypothetical protein